MIRWKWAIRDDRGRWYESVHFMTDKEAINEFPDEARVKLTYTEISFSENITYPTKEISKQHKWSFDENMKRSCKKCGRDWNSVILYESPYSECRTWQANPKEQEDTRWQIDKERVKRNKK